MVLVDPVTQQYRIDWERSALVNGLVPAQFTVSEDNKTYDLSRQADPLMEILQVLKANNVPLNRMVDIRSDRRYVSRSMQLCAVRPLSRRKSHRPWSTPSAVGAGSVATSRD
jgi:hypothetical protein